MSDSFDKNLLKDYFDEAFSQIEIIEKNILILEKDQSDKDAIDALFRAAHTLKGGSATVQMDEITQFTHLLEDVMDSIRSGITKITGSIIDILLNALDIIKLMVNERNNDNVYSEDYTAAVNGLNNIIKKSSAKEKKQSKSKFSDDNLFKSDEDLINDSKFKITEYELLELYESNPDNLPIFKVIVVFDESNPMRTVGGIQVFSSLRDIAFVLKTIPEFELIYSETFHKEIMYIIASNQSIEKIKDYSTIPDATQKIIVIPLETKNTNIKKNNPEIKEEIKKENIIKEDKVEKKLNTEVNPAKNEEEDDEDLNEISQEIKKKDSGNEKKHMQQQNISTSVLRVDSARIDVLLNLVSEIVINKATFNQIGIQFSDNLENFIFTLSDYKDKLKQFFDKILNELFIEKAIEKEKAIENEKTDVSIKTSKNELQNDFNNLYNNFDNFSNQYKSVFSQFKSNIQVLDRISSSLQEGVMRVRMVPMKQIFTRFPRLVRDLCRDLKKEVNLIINGEDTEIDKAMIDELIDPLIHIVRNCLDHGFETNEERERSGKPNPGTLIISAMNEGNVISISVSDDGRGIDLEKVRQKAIEKNLISSDMTLKELDAFNLLFEAGFSTADKVTAVSGRGVGLDVVKKNIEKLNGSIRINSDPGFGTIFTIKIPLTLAIIQGLMVEVSEEKYVIPISSVIETIRIKSEDIKTIDNYEIINVREDVMSLLRLNKLFNFEEKDRDFFYIIIVGTGNKKIGLLVDTVVGEEDIVIKPLKDKYTSTPGIAGATILGDGIISLILDISQLIELGLKVEKEKHGIK